MSTPLPTWRPGPVRDALAAFVEAVTNRDSPDYRPPAERIAVFDSDGTLWCEQPIQVQGLFCQARLKELAAADPSLHDRQPFRALLQHDLKAIRGLGKQGLLEVVVMCHAGMSVPVFQQQARTWLDQATNPILVRRCIDLIYQPQRELIAYLESHDFLVFIVTASGIDFVRSFAETVYGIPPQQVIGSSVKTELRPGPEGRMELYKLPELQSFNDRDEKVANIGLHIGRRPILAFGNSDGDLAMMRYTLAGPGRRLALLLHH
ncbi:MAG: HAD family hydrolase, partial [Brevundimonas sp.]